MTLRVSYSCIGASVVCGLKRNSLLVGGVDIAGWRRVSYYWYWSSWFRLRRYMYNYILRSYLVILAAWWICLVCCSNRGWLFYVVVGYLTKFMFSDAWMYPNCVVSLGSKVMCGYSWATCTQTSVVIVGLRGLFCRVAKEGLWDNSNSMDVRVQLCRKLSGDRRNREKGVCISLQKKLRARERSQIPEEQSVLLSLSLSRRPILHTLLVA